MSIWLWRALALGGIAVTLALVISDLAFPSSAGTYGFASRAEGRAVTVTEVDADSPAAKAGIAVGDHIALVPGLGQWQTFFVPSRGSTIVIDVRRGSTVRRVTLVAVAPKPPTPSDTALQITFELLRVVMLSVALLIVLRRPERADARALATFLIAFAFGILQGASPFSRVVTIVLLVLQQLSVFFALTQALLFATIFPYESTSGVRAFLRRFAPGVFGLFMVVYVLAFLMLERGDLSASNILLLLSAVVLIIATAVAFVLAFAGAPPSERQRLQWIAVSIVVGFVGLAVTVIFEAEGLTGWWTPVPALFLLAIPIGVSYAMFRHRVFDVSFVVSRALAFAMLSGIVVLAFSALEWLAGRFLVSAGHVQSVVLEASLALALGFSMDRLRVRVDRVVDNVFFRERHRAENALARFTQECAYITDPSVLAERTLDVLKKYAGADGAALYLYDAGTYRLRDTTMPADSAINANDPVIVSLRAHRAPADINDPDAAPSALPGIIAFPMFVRGDLTGIMCCGPRASGTAYDPGERQMLENLAAALANAFASIETAELRTAIGQAASGDLSREALRELQLRFS